MKNCLVTKLGLAINNDKLLRVGELRIGVTNAVAPTSSTQKISLAFNMDVKLEIIGDGYFTDSTLTSNNGKSLVVSANATTDVYVSNGVFDVAILNKYALTSIDINSENVIIPDVGVFKYSTLLTNMNLHLVKVSGDVSQLSVLTNLNILNLSDTNVNGDVGQLSTLTNLDVLNLNNTKISGDVDKMSSLVNLTSFNLFNVAIPLQANTSVLRNMSKLKDFCFSFSKLSGDLATTPSSLSRFVLYENPNSVLDWTSRPASANIIAMNGNPIFHSIDDMLINQAQCQVGFTASDDASFRTITAGGVRTSASDDAVATLQNKGYTISIAKQ